MGHRPGKASLVKGEDTKPEKEGNLQEQSHLLCALRSLQLLPGKSHVSQGIQIWQGWLGVWLCWGGPCCFPLRPYQNVSESWIPTSVSPTVYLGPQIYISE